MDIDPFPLEWEDDDHHIIESLIRQHEHAPKELRCRSFQVNGEEWLSWTMLEHLYRKTPSQYPTQARGLFTRRQPNGRYTVQVRGYDKFFNVNETAKTQWSALEQDTHGPYTITAKENGCIVFIAAVSPTELVVTSKHMIPDPQDDPTSHGGVGYRWLLHHLASAHQAPATLAAWLHKFRVTMVAELCDDDFEEHVVPYTTRGLYLHGINYNTTTLHTLPIDQVQTIGHHFGFHTIHHQKVSSFATLRSFVDDAQRMHQVMNENESEGIVIRCKRDSTAAMDFFFKVKYETYLMYREYREITKALVDIQQQQQQQDGDDGKITVVVRRRRGNKKLKIRFDRSLYYILWLQERVVDHPEWFYDYSRNKGIIAVRQAFEQDWKEGRLEGADIGAVQDWVERVHW